MALTREVEGDVIITAVPINGAGLIRMEDLRDFVMLTDEAPEDVYVKVLDGELRYEVGQ